MSVYEIARQIHRSPHVVYRLIRKGELPSTRLGGRIVIPRHAWTTWLARKTQEALANTAKDGTCTPRNTNGLTTTPETSTALSTAQTTEPEKNT